MPEFIKVYLCSERPKSCPLSNLKQGNLELDFTHFSADIVRGIPILMDCSVTKCPVKDDCKFYKKP
jgi:hypothetical protein